jgi:hexokinase
MAVGSLADAPKDLLKEIKHLEELFTVDTAKLKEITHHFVGELEKGEWLCGLVAGEAGAFD